MRVACPKIGYRETMLIGNHSDKAHKRMQTNHNLHDATIVL